MNLTVTKEQMSSIEFNKEEIRTNLNEQLRKYQDLVVTDETEKDCKNARAELNKLKTTIEDFRKSKKREMEKPIKTFENECKQLVGLVDSVIKPIDTSLKDLDQRRRDKKLEWVKNEVKKIAFEFGLDEKHTAQIDIKATWLTQSCKENKVTAEIKNVAEGLKLAQQTLEQNKALIVESCHRLGENPVSWLEMLNMYDIAYIIRLMNEKYEAPKVEAVAETVTEKERKEIIQDEVVEVAKEHVLVEEDVLTYSLKLTATRSKLKTLRQIIDDMGIKYEKL